MSGGIAAFFDLDGTLTELPSMERKLFRWLKTRGEISLANYFSWIAETMRLMPRGIGAIQHANKMHLRGTKVRNESDAGSEVGAARHTDGHQATGQAGTSSSGDELRNPGLPVPEFLDQAIRRVAWHARQGHKIVIVSGTLEPLALKVARALEEELAARGIHSAICVVATRLEERKGRWTGRIVGEAMFGEAKARSMKRQAKEMRLELALSFAYGDSLHDRWMLVAVGRPVAVNPQNELARLARARGWPIVEWRKERHPTDGTSAGSKEQSEQVFVDTKEGNAGDCRLELLEREGSE